MCSGLMDVRVDFVVSGLRFKTWDLLPYLINIYQYCSCAQVINPMQNGSASKWVCGFLQSQKVYCSSKKLSYGQLWRS